MQHASRLAEGVAGYVEESLIFLTENSPGVSNDRFGLNLPVIPAGQNHTSVPDNNRLSLAGSEAATR